MEADDEDPDRILDDIDELFELINEVTIGRSNPTSQHALLICTPR
jgi:hypothetical protein